MNTNLVSILISGIFLLFKFFEMKFITKQDRPIKKLFKETITVYISCLIGFFIFSQIEPIATSSYSTPNVFVNEPDF